MYFIEKSPGRKEKWLRSLFRAPTQAEVDCTVYHKVKSSTHKTFFQLMYVCPRKSFRLSISKENLAWESFLTQILA